MRWDAATCSFDRTRGSRPPRSTWSSERCEGSRHRCRRAGRSRCMQGPRKPTRGCASSPDPDWNRAAGSSPGSARRVRWCSPSVTASCCGKRDVARRSAAGWCSTSHRAAPSPRPIGSLLGAAAAPEELPRLLVQERGAVPAGDVSETGRRRSRSRRGDPRLGGDPRGPKRAARRRDRVPRCVPSEGAARSRCADRRRASDVPGRLRSAGAPADPGLVDAMLEDLAATGAIERTATIVRLAGHRVSLDADDADVRRLLDAIGGDHPASPPTVPELGARRHRPRSGRCGGGGRPHRSSLEGSRVHARAGARGRGDRPSRTRGHHGERVPRGARHEPEVRAPARSSTSTARASPGADGDLRFPR